MGWVRGEEVKVEGEEGKLKVSEDADGSRDGRGVNPVGSEILMGSQREWKLPTGSIGKRREYTPVRGDAWELFDDEEELLREMEREEEEMVNEEAKEGVEPMRKRPRFSMGRYRVIRRDEEDLPSPETNKEGSVAGDWQREGYVETLFEHEKMDETPASRPPSLPTVSVAHSEQQQPGQSQELPDSPDLKPVDSYGLTLVSPLGHGGLDFSDHMMDTSTLANSDVDCSGLKVHQEKVGISRTEPDITVSRPQSAGYDSTGPNSLFDSLSPSPDPENRSRGRSPAVQPSPLRNVHTMEGGLHRGMQEDWRNKVPLLLPGKVKVTRAIEEDAPLEDGNEGENDASREEDTAQGNGDEQGEEGHLMSVPRSTTIVLDDLLTHGTTQSTTRAQSNNASPSAASGGFQSGITTVSSDFPPLSHLAWGHIQDFIGVVCRTKPIERAKRGQRDHFMSMRVVDSSRPLGITVSVFRPRKDALPRVEVGDCVLLRNFRIISQERNLVAISTDTCAYAVWKNFGKEKVAVVNGPPVEWGVEEEEYIRKIGEWFEGLDDEVREDLGRWPEKKEKEKAVYGADGLEGEERKEKKGHGEATENILNKAA
ncbi:hypothetical protein EV426DRAFT_595689 [Tirmania nivea]|nr:hypothetical protein EV426DRAFT_595689 [Tirmania nivea]